MPNAIEYFPKKSIETAPLANTKFVISRFVLEHVPPDIIESIHKTLSEKLSENDYILHLISPSDHRAYTDKSISLYDFLQYSQKEWDTIQTKFDYHNRLRLPQYLTIFKKEFEIVHLEFQPCKEGTPQFKMFKSLYNQLNTKIEFYFNDSMKEKTITHGKTITIDQYNTTMKFYKDIPELNNVLLFINKHQKFAEQEIFQQYEKGNNQ